jgi:hypothetical protein
VSVMHDEIKGQLVRGGYRPGEADDIIEDLYDAYAAGRGPANLQVWIDELIAARS